MKQPIIISGTILKEKTKVFKRKDGEEGIERKAIIQQEGALRPIILSLRETDPEIGQEGDKINLKILAESFEWVKNKDNKSYRKDTKLNISIPHPSEEDKYFL